MNFPLDLLDHERRCYILIRVAEAWYNFLGEWDMLAGR